MSAPSEMERLERALAVCLDHRSTRTCSDAELLGRHPELADLLAPMLAEPEPAADRRIGDYRLVRELGRGGMGVVYEAVQSSLGRRVALKVLAEPLAVRPDLVARFRRESALLARFRHPHIVPVHEAGVHDGVPYHAMELVDGTTLAQLVDGLPGAELRDGRSLQRRLQELLADPAAGSELAGRSHVEVAVQCACGIAAALAAAHAEGILHRDVKPGNVLLRRDGTALLSDFGLARDERDPHLSRTGDFAGTPYYVSPEQAAGEAVDGRSDVFSFGIVLYELLLGEKPFHGDSTAEVLARVQLHEPSLFQGRHGRLPADLVAVLDKCLRKERDQRYASMQAVLDDLRDFLQLRPVSARRRSALVRRWQAVRRQPLRAGLTAAIGIGVALAAFLLWQLPRIQRARAFDAARQVEQLLERLMLGEHFQSAATGLAIARQAHALRPDLPETAAALAMATFLAGDDAGLARSIAELEALAPDVADQLRRREQAAEPTSALGWFVRGRMLMMQGHVGQVAAYREAIAATRKAMDRAPTPQPLFHAQLLHLLMHVDDCAGIADVAVAARQLWPDSAFIAYWCGFALRGCDPTRTAAELERAVALAPELPQAHLLLARAVESRAGAEALQHFARAAELAPDDPGVRVEYAKALRTAGDGAAARRQLEQALHTDPRCASALALRGDLSADAGQRDAAMRDFEAAIAVDPNEASTYFLRARHRLAAGDVAGALADAERAVDLVPGFPRYIERKGVMLLQAGRPGDAVAVLRTAVVLDPRSAYGWGLLAQALRRSKDPAGGRDAAQRALALDGSDTRALRELGKCQRALDAVGEAETAFAQAIALDDGDAESRINLAGLRIDAGRNEDALELLAAARERAPELPQAWNVAIGLLHRLGRTPEEIELRVAACARFRTDVGMRVRLLDAVLSLPPGERDAELVANAFRELAALGAADQPAVQALRARAEAR